MIERIMRRHFKQLFDLLDVQTQQVSREFPPLSTETAEDSLKRREPFQIHSSSLLISVEINSELFGIRVWANSPALNVFRSWEFRRRPFRPRSGSTCRNGSSRSEELDP